MSKAWIDQIRQRLKKKKSPLALVTRWSLETWEEQFWRCDTGERRTEEDLRKNGRGRNEDKYRQFFHGILLLREKEKLDGRQKWANGTSLF